MYFRNIIRWDISITDLPYSMPNDEAEQDRLDLVCLKLFQR